MIHKPSGFPSDPKCPVNLVTRYTALTIPDKLHGYEPLVETDGGIFHHGSRLSSELPGRMRRAALPAIVLGKEDDLRTAATRVDYAVGPSQGYQILTAVIRIGEVQNSFL
jgi:hypothetical protein